MVKIRLTRTGKRHEPHYRIVATDSRVKRDGKYIEKIGYYNPRTKPPTLDFDKEILMKWIDQGAQMTETVHDIFVREGVIKQTSQREAQIKKIIEVSKKRTVAAEKDEAGEPSPEKPAEKTEEKKSEEKPADKKEDAKEEPATNKEDSPKEADDSKKDSPPAKDDKEPKEKSADEKTGKKEEKSDKT